MASITELCISPNVSFENQAFITKRESVQKGAGICFRRFKISGSARVDYLWNVLMLEFA
jgi:hypothetical protein